MCENIEVINRSYLKINKDYKHFSNIDNCKLPLIRLYYGPIECNGFIKHKPQKLHGLIKCLKKYNFDVEVIPAAHLNILIITVLGYDVYRMNLKFLQFNIDCNFDNMCLTVLEKVKEAVFRLYNDRNIAKHVVQWYEDLLQNLSVDSASESEYNMPVNLKTL